MIEEKQIKKHTDGANNDPEKPFYEFFEAFEAFALRSTTCLSLLCGQLESLEDEIAQGMERWCHGRRYRWGSIYYRWRQGSIKGVVKPYLGRRSPRDVGNRELQYGYLGAAELFLKQLKEDDMAVDGYLEDDEEYKLLLEISKKCAAHQALQDAIQTIVGEHILAPVTAGTGRRRQPRAAKEDRLQWVEVWEKRIPNLIESARDLHNELRHVQTSFNLLRAQSRTQFMSYRLIFEKVDYLPWSPRVTLYQITSIHRKTGVKFYTKQPNFSKGKMPLTIAELKKACYRGSTNTARELLNEAQTLNQQWADKLSGLNALYLLSKKEIPNEC